MNHILELSIFESGQTQVCRLYVVLLQLWWKPLKQDCIKFTIFFLNDTFVCIFLFIEKLSSARREATFTSFLLSAQRFVALGIHLA